MPTTFANTIDGNDIFAKRAECDAAGNDLSTTYATKSELPDGVPAVTSSDNNKVLKASYSGGVASYSWQNESGGGGGGGSYTAGTGIDITNDVISVDTSVVATQTDLADKEDAFTVGTGLEMDTSGATPTLQVETPMDIVAGPGISIDNPDSDTLRVSVGTTFTQAQLDYLKRALGVDETVLWEADLSVAVQDRAAGTQFQLSELPTNFERLKILSAKKWPITSDQDLGVACSEVSLSMLSKQNGGKFLIHGIMVSGTVYYLATLLTGCLTQTITESSGMQSSSAQGQLGSTVFLHPYKIVGIHRIANN